jgi:hypothetical protein
MSAGPESQSRAEAKFCMFPAWPMTERGPSASLKFQKSCASCVTSETV